MVMYRSAAKEQSGSQHNPLQVSEEELQESDSRTITSGSVETEESGLLLDSREQIVQQQRFDDVITLGSDEDADNMEQLNCVDTQQDDECVDDKSTNEQPRPSTLDDQLSSCTSNSEVQLSAVGSGDFGNAIQHKVHLTDHQNLMLLKKHFVPASDSKFPTRVINRIQRHFQHSWLCRYPGLVYSKSHNGGYCKYCVLFGKHEPSVKELGIFVMKPFTNFKKASEQLGGHFHGTKASKGSKTHYNAMQDATTFMKAMKKKGTRIDHHLSSLHSKQVEETI